MTTLLRVDDATAVGEAQRTAAVLAEQCGLDEIAVASVVTELATSVQRRGGGHLLFRAVDDVTGRYFETIACDNGLELEGGDGLGSIARLSTDFDVFSQTGNGTVVLSRVGTVAPLPCLVGVVSIPYPGEDVCGDTYRVQCEGARVRASVIDGLGHGEGAAAAATAALAALDRAARRTLVEVLDEAHRALRDTRGAALGVGEFDFIARRLEWVGVGNIAGTVFDTSGKTHGVVSQNGIVGRTVRNVRTFHYDWPVGGTAVLMSDGITTSWDLERYRGVMRRHPAIVAALVHRDFNRGRDDATVMVLRDDNVPHAREVLGG